MKKIIGVLLLVVIFALPASAYAASKPLTEKQIMTEMAKQQKIYDDNVALARVYISQLVESKTMTFHEKIALRMKLDGTEDIYLAAAKEMDKLRIALFELHNPH